MGDSYAVGVPLFAFLFSWDDDALFPSCYPSTHPNVKAKQQSARGTEKQENHAEHTHQAGKSTCSTRPKQTATRTKQTATRTPYRFRQVRYARRGVGVQPPAAWQVGASRETRQRDTKGATLRQYGTKRATSRQYGTKELINIQMDACFKSKLWIGREQRTNCLGRAGSACDRGPPDKPSTPTNHHTQAQHANLQIQPPHTAQHAAHGNRADMVTMRT